MTQPDLTRPHFRIGIDLGGTKIEGILLDPAGRERARQRLATPLTGYEATLAAIRQLVGDLEAPIAPETATVGVGTPGAISPATGLIKNANSTYLIGHPFDRDLSAALGREVRTANDANCFAVSEAVDGAAAGLDLVFGVILGTGVGGGIAVQGRAWTGKNAIAGEWGHNPLPRQEPDEIPGPRCYCGRLGCIEAFLCGAGLADQYAAATGRRLVPAEIDRAARAGETEAEAVLVRYEARLARALGAMVNILDPDAVVLGGGLSNLERLYRNLPRLWGQHIFSDRVDTPILPAKHGDSSGVRGAAWLWPA